MEYFDDLQTFLTQYDMYAAPFKVGWYNEKRLSLPGRKKHQCQLLEGENIDDNCVGFVIYGGPRYFEKAIVPYYYGANRKDNHHYVDNCTAHIQDQLQEKVFAGAAIIRDLLAPPLLHLQTMGHVSGMDQHIEPHENDAWVPEVAATCAQVRDPLLWGSAAGKVFGVSVHPRFGGWYAYRIVVIIPGSHEEIPRPAALDFCSEELKKIILIEYNLRPNDGLWRELPDMKPEDRYSVHANTFFVHAISMDDDARKECLRKAAIKLSFIEEDSSTTTAHSDTHNEDIRDIEEDRKQQI